MDFLVKFFRQVFHLSGQPFLVSGVNFVDRLSLEVLCGESLGFIVGRFDVAARVGDALLCPPERFGGLTALLITHVTAVIVPITLVALRNASAVGAGELGGAARVFLSPLVAAIATVVVAVANPVALDAPIVVALKLRAATCSRLLVARIPTVVIAIVAESQRNTPAVIACELAICTCAVPSVALVAHVATVIVAVPNELARDAAPRSGAAELAGTATG